MTNNNNHRVGSKIVERGKVYRVFKINKKKYNGKVERIIHYCPYYKDPICSGIVFSIPESSLSITNIRHPVTKNEMLQHLKFLSKRSRNLAPIDAVQAKTVLNLNDIEKTIEILKCCWTEKRKDDDTFSKPKQEILELAIERTIEEVALIFEISLEKAKNKISLALA